MPGHRAVMPALFGCLLTLWLPAALCSERTAPPGGNHYASVPASRDGIGKSYMGREIAQVMGWSGASWLERAERQTEERPDLVLDTLGLAPGMVVADVGAGSGFYSWRIGKRVGARGSVYAVDIQTEMYELLRAQMARRGAKNVKPVLGAARDPHLPAETIDLAVMVDVYHELEFPHEMLVAIVRALKPGGRIAFVEYRGNDPAVPIKPLHTMTEAQVRKEAANHPLEWVKTVRKLPWQQVVFFRKR
jgi:ubiquinone/menaquinone biosynthesis C-methylase UbiE